MSRLFPNPEAKWNGSKCPGRSATPDVNGEGGKERNGSSDPDLCAAEPGSAAELERLRAENAELRSFIDELEKELTPGPSSTDSSWEAQQKEYESLLEEKSEVIRSLHRKLQELQIQPGASNAEPPREQELLALSEELERERRQLKEDEEALMKQMRDMEVTMSRERAELARQRNEVIRLQGDIRHELELANRDGALRERLAPLQRRHQELTSRRGSGPAPVEPSVVPPPAPAAPPPPPPDRKDSGIFRRLFGQGG